MASAVKRGWKVALVNEPLGLVRYTDLQGHDHYSQSVLTADTNAWQVLVAKNKDILYSLALSWGLPIPTTSYYENQEQATNFLRTHKKIVAKPKDGAHGKGVTTHIATPEKLTAAVSLAQTINQSVLLQEHIEGEDYRVLFIGGTSRAVAIREPASVVGDGKRTVQQLIALENTNSERGENYQTRLNKIDREASEQFLGEDLQTIPKNGERVQVVGPANIGIGGSSRNVTDVTPPAVLELANAVAEKLQLGLAGIDIIFSPQNGPTLIEINANPSFGLHMLPQEGTPQPVADDFLDWLEHSIDLHR